jgi:protease-4
MTEKPKGAVRRVFGALWRGLDQTRRFTVNVLFVVLVVLLLGWLLSGGGPDIPDQTALVLAPDGDLVEQLSGDPLDRALEQLAGDAQPETLMRDLLDSIAAAETDDRVQVLLLDLNDMGGAGLSKLQTLRAAIEDFKSTGKKVIAAADSYTQSSYYLATAADEIHMHEMGLLLLPGYGRYRSYYKDGLDRLEVDMHIFRVGEYKSAVEPFLRNDMSDHAREANLEWLGDLWDLYLTDVAAARGMTEEQLRLAVDGFLDALREEHTTAKVALRFGLVDHIGNRDAVRDRMIELLGEDEEGTSFPQVDSETYLTSLDRRPSEKTGDAKVAVIVARGTIVDGTAPPGEIGGDSTAALIREARQDDAVKALVLRVDSGGGSAFASEVIRREFELARAAGKPVVVSMGSVAASGGYWISSASDEIWARPSTITGSIGIFGMFPTFQKPLAKYLGTRVDGVGTTPLAGALRLDRELAPEVGEAIQVIVDQGYEDFLEHVSEARDMTRDEVDRIARGRVWSGADAHELGLVDHLGGLDQAIASAAEKAGLGEDYGVRFVHREPSFRERLMADLLTRVATVVGRIETRRRPSVQERLLDFLDRQTDLLRTLDDPNGLYAHCLCVVE